MVCLSPGVASCRQPDTGGQQETAGMGAGFTATLPTPPILVLLLADSLPSAAADWLPVPEPRSEMMVILAAASPTHPPLQLGTHPIRAIQSRAGHPGSSNGCRGCVSRDT